MKGRESSFVVVDVAYSDGVLLPRKTTPNHVL